jgi:hypothetical protein
MFSDEVPTYRMERPRDHLAFAEGRASSSRSECQAALVFFWECCRGPIP